MELFCPDVYYILHEHRAPTPLQYRLAQELIDTASVQANAGPSGLTPAQMPALPLFGAAAASTNGVRALPPYISRRLLELFTTLARHQVRLASEAVCMEVPDSATFLTELAAKQDRKGKGKAREAVATHQRGLEVVLELLSKGICRRSNTHLEQALHLLDVLLQSAKVEIVAKQALFPSP